MLTPALKWTIGLATVAAIGLGTWLAVALYNNQNKPAASDTATQDSLPAPVETSLNDSSDDTSSTEPTESTPTPAPSTSKRSSSTKVTTKSSTSTHGSSTTTTTQSTASTLSVSFASSSMNGRTTVTVAANQPVVIGVDSVSGSDYVTAKTLDLGTLNGTKTIIARSKDGQERTFTVSGSSSSSSTNININSTVQS